MENVKLFGAIRSTIRCQIYRLKTELHFNGYNRDLKDP
jgi:hypothetical protein